ncbi:hypothetical protein PhCBS80983_g02909 [Powellomyces hirtus]|uniref:RING-type E3 ubiquitin transferase n=1 Tax=Powellomyces hirtus TaxID=109895 RepID=A0A507E6R7_9FUNG|nr:hypothetical protein PhCBS80983_g02909 [Powellomyces hirtus]
MADSSLVPPHSPSASDPTGTHFTPPLHNNNGVLDVSRNPGAPSTTTSPNPIDTNAPTNNTTSDSQLSSPPSPSSPSSQITVRIQLFPHSDRPAHIAAADAAGRHTAYTAFSFLPVEKDLYPGSIVRIGRKVDRHNTKVSRHATKTKSRRDRSHNVANGLEEMEFDAESPPIVSLLQQQQQQLQQQQLDTEAELVAHIGELKRSSDGKTVKRKADYVAFRSKVVSRTHAEIWVDRDGAVYFRDVGSSSGTFLNRLRLSPSGRESPPYTLKNGDVVQLGVDYQGRVEEIYKCVMFKIFVTVKTGVSRRLNPERLRTAVGNLISAMNPTAGPHDVPTSECCICLNSLSPFQSLFLAPCSHCFHYKCVTPLLGSGIMFLCPMCRQVANLEAAIAEDEDAWLDSTNAASSSTSHLHYHHNRLLNGGSSMEVGNEPGNNRPASIRSVQREDVEKRVKMILEEAERPLPRVTASDLDALLSDGEGDGSTNLNHITTQRRHSEHRPALAAPPDAPCSNQSSGPTHITARSSPDTSRTTSAATTIPSTVPTAPAPAPSTSLPSNLPTTPDLHFLSSPPDSWNTTLVRPSARNASYNHNTQPPSPHPASDTTLIVGSAGDAALMRQKTSVNKRHHHHAHGASHTPAAGPAAPASTQQDAENSRLRALLAHAMQHLPREKADELARELAGPTTPASNKGKARA